MDAGSLSINPRTCPTFQIPGLGLAILVAKIRGGQLAGFRRDVRIQWADKDERRDAMAACKKLGCLQSLGVCAKRRMIVLNMGS